MEVSSKFFEMGWWHPFARWQAGLGNSEFFADLWPVQETLLWCLALCLSPFFLDIYFLFVFCIIIYSHLAVGWEVQPAVQLHQ